jgi:hypothetical protein
MTHSRLLLSLRSLALVLAFCSLSHAQTTINSTQTTAVTPVAFDSAYWAHQPPAVAALNSMAVDWSNPTSGGRTSSAIALATQGYSIDNDIDVWGWDPYETMYERQLYGYTWVPSLLQPNLLVAAGNLTFNGQTYNASAPPAGSILVSLSLSAYPPFAPPAPPAPPVAAPASCVGTALGAGYYAATYYSTVPVCKLTNGQVYVADPRGYFTFHVSATPFGSNVWFTSQSGN